MLIIGRNPILETLQYSPGSVKKIYVLNNLNDRKLNEIFNSALKKGIAIEKKNKQEFDKIFNKKDKSEGISQGIAAYIEDYKYSDEASLVSKLGIKNASTIMVLDEIQDPHNLGAIIRTSAAAGVDAIIVSEKNSVKVNHTVMKASAGAVNYIRIALTGNTIKTLTNLKENGYYIFGTSLKGEKSHFETVYPSHTVIVFGNEGEGIRKNVLKVCDSLIKIPIGGKVESLNVSVSAGVILYEIVRQKTLPASLKYP